MDNKIDTNLRSYKGSDISIILNKPAIKSGYTFENGVHIVSNYIGATQRLVNVDVESIQQNIQPQECIHHKYIYGLSLLVVGKNAKPEDIFEVDMINDVTKCKICKKTIDCGHVGFMAFMLTGNDNIDKMPEIKIMKERYYYIDGNSQPCCSICKKIMSIESQESDPMGQIRGIINYATQNDVRMEYARFEQLAIFALNQLNFTNFKGMIDSKRGAPYLIGLALSYYPHVPTSNEGLQEYFVHIGSVMFSILGWYHLNFGFNDNYDVLAIKNSTNKDGVALGFEMAIKLDFQMKRIFESANDIKSIISKYIGKINKMATERLNIIVTNIFHIINRGKDMTKLPKHQQAKRVKRGIFPSIARPDDMFPAPIKKINHEPINAGIGDDGHIHKFIGSICTLCKKTWKDVKSGNVDIERWDKACEFQEYNHHRCKNNTIHVIASGKCIRCGLSPDMPIEEIYDNDDILNNFKEITINISSAKQLTRRLVDIKQPPKLDTHGKGHFLSFYIERSHKKEYLNLDDGEPVAICNCISALTNTVIYALKKVDILTQKMIDAAGQTNGYYNKIMKNSMYDKHKKQLFDWYVYFLEIVGRENKINPQLKNVISTSLSAKEEYRCINTHTELQQGYNIIERLRYHRFMEEIKLREEEEEGDIEKVMTNGNIENMDIEEFMSDDDDIEVISKENKPSPIPADLSESDLFNDVDNAANNEDVINHDDTETGDDDFDILYGDTNEIE